MKGLLGFSPGALSDIERELPDDLLVADSPPELELLPEGVRRDISEALASAVEGAFFVLAECLEADERERVLRAAGALRRANLLVAVYWATESHDRGVVGLDQFATMCGEFANLDSVREFARGVREEADRLAAEPNPEWVRPVLLEMLAEQMASSPQTTSGAKGSPAAGVPSVVEVTVEAQGAILLNGARVMLSDDRHRVCRLRPTRDIGRALLLATDMSVSEFRAVCELQRVRRDAPESALEGEGPGTSSWRKLDTALSEQHHLRRAPSKGGERLRFLDERTGRLVVLRWRAPDPF